MFIIRFEEYEQTSSIFEFWFELRAQNDYHAGANIAMKTSIQVTQQSSKHENMCKVD